MGLSELLDRTKLLRCKVQGLSMQGQAARPARMGEPVLPSSTQAVAEKPVWTDLIGQHNTSSTRGSSPGENRSSPKQGFSASPLLTLWTRFSSAVGVSPGL